MDSTDRQIFYFEDSSGIVDRLEVVMKANNAYFTVESDYAGDTERGFGESCSIDVPADEALRLAEMILIWAKTKNEKL